VKQKIFLITLIAEQNMKIQHNSFSQKKHVIIKYLQNKKMKQEHNDKTIDYSNIEINADDLTLIVEVLKTKPIESLFLQNSHLNKKILLGISKVFNVQKSLKEIDLSDNPQLLNGYRVGGVDWLHILTGMKKISPVSAKFSGILSEPDLKADGGLKYHSLEVLFKRVIEAWDNLEYLDLSRCNIASVFLESILNKPSLTQLVVSSSTIRKPLKLGHGEQSPDASSLIIKKLQESVDFSIKFDHTQGIDQELIDLSDFVHIKAIESETIFPEAVAEVVWQYLSFGENLQIELCGEYVQPYLVEADHI